MQTTAEASLLVLGATGRVGAAVARGLLAEGQRVRVLVRDASRAQPLASAGAELFAGDLRRPESLRPALVGAHVRSSPWEMPGRGPTACRRWRTCWGRCEAAPCSSPRCRRGSLG
ncbi:SDR family oxidoreductase [Pyxidicoccus xibeiensis]|uniref:SDR family oxidoreductase n=1 Tax=Pyxidicoccus xibeiensis TaxID=2906759 RepID=UPI0020A6EF88|nr:NmrA family NAD(P)-binding protein [Pyxidicoccus xibeiensis]